jgi:hypothetical protein
MEYIILIVAFVIIISVVSKKTFYWETIVTFLWKHVYREMNVFSSYLNDKELGKDETSEDYNKFIKYNRDKLSVPGNLINAILDYVNSARKEKNEDSEEETFGYGYYNFDTMLDIIKRNPGAFKNK